MRLRNIRRGGTEFLVNEGIYSMSLNPDSVMKITLRVLEMEEKENRK